MEWNGASMSMSMIHVKILYTSDLFCAQAGSNDDEWTCQKPNKAFKELILPIINVLLK